MNADNFTRYLRDPSLLYQVSYQELKSLSLQYPYCQNLHLLMLQKSFMEDMQDWKKNLEKTAVYSVDRALLYQLVKNGQMESRESEGFLLEEEYLELKSLKTLGREELPIEASPGVEEEEAPIAQQSEMHSPDSRPDTTAEEEEEEDENASLYIDAESAAWETEKPLSAPPADSLASQEAPSASAASRAFVADEELIQAMCTLAALLADMPAVPPPAPERKAFQLPSPELAALNRPARKSRYSPPVLKTAAAPSGNAKPQPKNSFTSWVEQFQSPTVQIRLDELMESRKLEEARRARKKKHKKKKGDARIPRLALRSITENEEVASETLAQLLAAQGSSLQAEEMYRRLMLVFPEKSDYFAEKIKNLKSE